jgi:HD-GYP domain-containing protein (c-di-GMP phosphodiesterase class II)
VSESPDQVIESRKAQWRGHTQAALALRLAIFVVPLTMAAFLGLEASRSISGTTVGSHLLLRVLLTAVVSVAAFLLAERLARRFLPLAALLRLNLVFPDRAPSRFSVALRSTSLRQLQQWIGQAPATDSAAVVAEKVVTLAAALNTHDRRTRGHCERTRALADLIVEELHLSPAEANQVRWGAFLHDIGKLVVPAEILNKPGQPTNREWEVLRSHPEAGARLVEPLRPFLHSGVDAVGCHHENFDGSGYPHGLAGQALPLAARIVSVADAFEVMTAVRAYKRPLSLQAARAELARRSGSQFDPLVVRAFLHISLGRVHWATGMAAWVAELPFLSVVPRVAAQLSTAAAGGAIAPAALPALSAASLGALAVIGHVHGPSPSPPSSRAAPSAPAVTRAPVPTPMSTGGTPPTASPAGPAPTGAIVSAPGAVTGTVAAPVHDVTASVAPLERAMAQARTDRLPSSATGPVSSGRRVVEAPATAPTPGSITTPAPATAAMTATVARTASGLSGLLPSDDPGADPLTPTPSNP